MAEIVPPGDGFEKLIMGVANGLAKTETAVMNVVYGKNDPLGGVKFPGNVSKTNGLIPILREINKIDLCHVINYALGNISLVDGAIGEKVNKLSKLAREINDVLDLTFIDPSKAKNPEKVSMLVLYIVELNELIDSEIVSIFPKIQDYKTMLSNLSTTLIQYGAAAKSYSELNEALKKELDKNPNGTTIDKASSDSHTIVTIQSKNGNTDIEVPVSLISNIGRTIDTTQKVTIPQIDVSQIPIAEVQKLMSTIRDVKSVLSVIISITSVGDLASLLIPQEIQELQKIVNPAKLLPVIRKIAAYANAANQVAQQVLGYASVAKTIVKVITVIIKVVQIAIQIFRLLPMPLMFATSGVMDGLVWARQLLDGQLDGALKRVEQLGKLIDIVYAFASTIAGMIQDIVIQLEILIFNLESCSPSELVAQLKEIKAKLQDSLIGLNGLSGNYEKAKKLQNETTYNGYIFRIEEEQVEEATITAKRRRAIAYDLNEIMVLATDLTFATDKTLLFEELRLKLVNNKLTKDTGKEFGALSNIINILGVNNLPETNEEIYASLGMKQVNGVNPEEQMKSEMSAVQKSLNAVISNIKGGDDLKKLSQKEVLKNNQTLRSDIQQDKVDLTKQPASTTTQAVPSNPIAQITQNPDILTDAEVKRLENLIIRIDNSPNARGLVNTNQYVTAKDKLKKNAEARAAAGM